jgi:hypothetical protein
MKGWREEVEKYLQVMGARRWRELVMDREKWRGCSTGQSPQRAVAPTEEEEEEEVSKQFRKRGKKRD